jgi:peptidyl-prolyl cis-trans isomerase C
MYSRILILFVIAALVLPSLGCSGDKGEDGSAAGSMEGGALVVTVNGRELYENEIRQEEDRIRTQLAGRVPMQQLEGMGEVIRQQAINNMINRVLLEKAADREKIEIPEDVVKERADQVKSGFGSDDAFKEQLEASGLTEAGFQQEVELALRIESLLDGQTDDLQATEESDVRDFYDTNIERFKKPEQVQASHILIPFGETDGEPEKAVKHEKIDSLLTEIRGGADFAQLASEHSSCPSKTRGGDLGFFGRGQMVKEFEDAAFGMGVGDVSGIVETQFGYHIIKVTDQQAASTVPFDDAKGDILAYLDGQRKQQAVGAYIDSLRVDANIVYPDTTAAE